MQRFRWWLVEEKDSNFQKPAFCYMLYHIKAENEYLIYCPARPTLDYVKRYFPGSVQPIHRLDSWLLERQPAEIVKIGSQETKKRKSSKSKSQGKSQSKSQTAAKEKPVANFITSLFKRAILDKAWTEITRLMRKKPNPNGI